MKRRKWDSKTKARIVLEGLSGRPISELCSEYEISQNQYYIWRDKFLKDSHRAFEKQDNGREVASGMYLYRLKGDRVESSRKMILLK